LVSGIRPEFLIPLISAVNALAMKGVSPLWCGHGNPFALVVPRSASRQIGKDQLPINNTYARNAVKITM
jgi:hypothetical protein